MLFAATPVVAGDFEDGIAAYWAGDHQKAFGLIEPLAEQGHAPAQAHLGLTYLHGTGAPQGQRQGGLLVHQGGEAGDSDGAVQPWYDVRQGPGRSRRRYARVRVV